MKLNENTLQKPLVIACMAIVANLLWGSAAPTIKTGYMLFQVAAEDSASQILFAGIRFFLAGVMATAIGSLLQGRLLRPGKGAMPKVFALAMFQTIIQYSLFYIGCAHASGSKASIVSSSSAFISIIFASLLFHQEKLTMRKVFGCVLGFSGVVLVNISSVGGIDLDMSLKGEGFVLLSTCSFALSNALTKEFSRTEDPVMLCGYQFMLGGAVLTAAGLLLGGSLIYPGPSGLLIILYLGMLSAVAFSLTSMLIKYNPVSRVSIFNFMNPIFGVSLSIIMLGESGREFGLKGIIALALVCLGVLTVNYHKKSDKVTETKNHS